MITRFIVPVNGGIGLLDKIVGYTYSDNTGSIYIEGARMTKDYYNTNNVLIPKGTNITVTNAVQVNGQYVLTTESHGTLILPYWEPVPFSINIAFIEGSIIHEFNPMSVKNATYNPKLTIATGGIPVTISK